MAGRVRCSDAGGDPPGPREAGHPQVGITAAATSRAGGDPAVSTPTSRGPGRRQLLQLASSAKAAGCWLPGRDGHSMRMVGATGRRVGPTAAAGHQQPSSGAPVTSSGTSGTSAAGKAMP